MTPKEYQTSDLYLAAYLKSAGVPMLEPRRTHDGRVQFVFDNSLLSFDEVKQGWFNGKGRVSASSYAYEIKQLKALCHSALEGGSAAVVPEDIHEPSHTRPHRTHQHHRRGPG